MVLLAVTLRETSQDDTEGADVATGAPSTSVSHNLTDEVKIDPQGYGQLSAFMLVMYLTIGVFDVG